MSAGVIIKGWISHQGGPKGTGAEGPRGTAASTLANPSGLGLWWSGYQFSSWIVTNTVEQNLKRGGGGKNAGDEVCYSAFD